MVVQVDGYMSLLLLSVEYRRWWCMCLVGFSRSLSRCGSGAWLRWCAVIGKYHMVIFTKECSVKTDLLKIVYN